MIAWLLLADKGIVGRILGMEGQKKEGEWVLFELLGERGISLKLPSITRSVGIVAVLYPFLRLGEDDVPFRTWHFGHASWVQVGEGNGALLKNVQKHHECDSPKGHRPFSP